MCAPNFSFLERRCLRYRSNGVGETSGLGLRTGSSATFGSVQHFRDSATGARRIDSFGSWRGALRSALCRALRSRAGRPVADELTARPRRPPAREAKEKHPPVLPEPSHSRRSERGFDTVGVHKTQSRSSNDRICRRNRVHAPHTFLADRSRPGVPCGQWGAATGATGLLSYAQDGGTHDPPVHFCQDLPGGR